MIMAPDQSYLRFDWALKRLLRDKANFEVLEGFLSALLNEEVKIIEILESESNRYSPYDKSNIVDIKARNHKDEIIIIEVQNIFEMDFMQRLVYGASKAVVEQVSIGDKYGIIHKVYSIAIVYFDLGTGGDDYVFRGQTSLLGLHSNKELKVSERERTAYQSDSYTIFPEYYILKVNNFNQLARTPLEEWMDYIKNGRISPNTKNKGLIRAKKILAFDKMTKEEQNIYQRYLVEKWSEQDSLEKERAEGYAKGVEKGRSEGQLVAARKFIETGMDKSQVAKILGLTPEEQKLL